MLIKREIMELRKTVELIGVIYTYLGLLLVSFRGNGGQEWNEGQSKLQRKSLGKGDKQNGQHRRSLTLLETCQELKPSRCRSSSEQMQA